MGTIPTYPGIAGALTGDEVIPAWKDGQQVAIPSAKLFGESSAIALAQAAIATAAAATATSRAAASDTRATAADGSAVAAAVFATAANGSAVAAAGSATAAQTIVGTAQVAFDSIMATLGLLQNSAPPNLAPNSQWELMSSSGGFDLRFNEAGTDTLGTLNLTSHSTGNNLVSFNFTGDASVWRVGDLMAIAGSNQPAISFKAMEILSLSAGNMTARCPWFLSPSATSTGTIKNVNIGCSASLNNGFAADGWTKSTTAIAWREDYPSNVPLGALFSLGYNKRIADPETFSRSLPVRYFRGQTVTFGILVKQRVRGTGSWRVYINTDGTGGTVSYGPAATAAVNSWQWLEKTVVVPSNATYFDVGVEFNGSRYDTYYLARPVIAMAPRIGAGPSGLGNYIKPRESIRTISSIEPWIAVGTNTPPLVFPTATTSLIPVAALGYSFYVNFYADSGGAMAKTIRTAHGRIEGVNDSAPADYPGNAPIMGWIDSPTAPARVGCILPHYVAKKKDFALLDLGLTDGVAYCVSGLSADSWYNVSIDLDTFVLEGM